MMLQTLLLSVIMAAAGWMGSSLPSTRVTFGTRGFASTPLQFINMQEDAAPAAATEQVSDFTEDLLDALTTDDASLVDEAAKDEPLTFMKGAEGVLEPLPSHGNALSVDDMRAKYKTHENDTGSSQVQIAVLTARIAYMTKHMQSNKKDYSSLRGLTAMVTRRRKLLEFLLREDVDEFARITSELGIRTNQLLKPKLRGARGRRV